MHKNALFFEEKNWKIIAALKPQVVTPITFYSYFLEEVCSTNIISVKKELKELRNITNVLLLPLISHFKLCTGYPNSVTGSDFSSS